MILSPDKAAKLGKAPLQPLSSKADFETLINKTNNGRIIGKPSTAINAKLLFVLEAIAETIVKSAANPIPPNNIVVKKRAWFSI